MQVPPALKATTASDPGAVHTVNGDTLGVREPKTAIERVEQGTIWVIADGVGNEIAGLEAGRAAVETIIDSYWSSAVSDRSARLRNAVEKANAQLYSKNQSADATPGAPSGLVGATILAAVIAEGRRAGARRVALTGRGDQSPASELHHSLSGGEADGRGRLRGARSLPQRC